MTTCNAMTQVKRKEREKKKRPKRERESKTGKGGPRNNKDRENIMRGFARVMNSLTSEHLSSSIRGG